jgi:hypothetical protein
MIKNEAFSEELTQLLNKYSIDTECSTPDYMLAKYIISSLDALTQTHQTRDVWFSRVPTLSTKLDEVPYQTKDILTVDSKTLWPNSTGVFSKGVPLNNGYARGVSPAFVVMDDLGYQHLPPPSALDVIRDNLVSAATSTSEGSMSTVPTEVQDKVGTVLPIVEDSSSCSNNCPGCSCK